jgi:rhodanese-related sulfurtransferase
MKGPVRVSPPEIRDRVVTGAVLLVCAYADERKFDRRYLEGAISLTDFKSRLSALSKDQEIVFYCSCINEVTAAARAVCYLDKGFRKVRVLRGGVEGWKKAGYPLW